MDATANEPQPDSVGGEAVLDSRSEILRGALAALPIAPAIAAYGLVFGAQATQRGLSFWKVPPMTGSNYAGGSEFAAINVWASPPPILPIAALTPFIQHFPRWKAFLILFFMSDESWAIGFGDTLRRSKAGSAPPFSLRFYIGDAAVIYLNWLLSTTAGAAIGPFLGDVDRYGFDMAFPAVFLFILASMWKGVRAARPWLVSFAVGPATHLLVPGAWYIIVGTVASLGAAYAWAKP